MEILGADVPTPILISLVLFVFMTLVILDAGAGTPIFYPLMRPFFRPYKPSAGYEKLKSKYL